MLHNDEVTITEHTTENDVFCVVESVNGCAGANGTFIGDIETFRIDFPNIVIFEEIRYPEPTGS